MRRFINITLTESSAAVQDIAAQVRAGSHEGFSPYWKLLSDERVLGDELAMMHISELISDGFTSGVHPSWELKTVEDTTAHDPVAPVMHDAVIDEEEVVDHEVGEVDIMDGYEHCARCGDEYPAGELDESGECVQCQADQSEIEEEVLVPPAELHPDHPEMEKGRGIQDYLDAQYMDKEAYDPHYFDGKPDYQVQLACVHDRGPRQKAALRELTARDLVLSDEQKAQAGLLD